LQPIRRFGFDAAILFCDILVVAEGLGQRYQFRDRGGIEMEFLLKSAADIERLEVGAVTERLQYVAQALPLIKSALGGRTALIGFSGARADTRIASLSGGEKARLLMGLATFDGPQLIILDEPTNHLDIDSRAELIEAINDYAGACILVSHDRRLLEACVDRLWLVADGTVRAFDGDVADYSRFVLAATVPREKRKEVMSPKADAPAERRENPKSRRDRAPLRKEIVATEQKMHRFQDLLRRIDEALAKTSESASNSAKVVDLAQKRSELETALQAAEETWLALSSQAEAAE